MLWFGCLESEISYKHWFQIPDSRHESVAIYSLSFILNSNTYNNLLTHLIIKKGLIYEIYQ